MDLYQLDFPQQDKQGSQQIKDDSYFEYTVELDDTLFGLELKFDISQPQLLQINNISESTLYPGMVIKIPKRISQQQDTRGNQNRSGSFIGVNLMDEIMRQKSNHYYDCYYITQLGHIKGVFTCHADICYFDPDIRDKRNCDFVNRAKLRNISVLQVQILMKHIFAVDPYILPTRITDDSRKPIRDQCVKFHIQTSKQKILFFKLLDNNELQGFLQEIKTHQNNYIPFTPGLIADSPPTMELKTMIPYSFKNTEDLPKQLEMAIQSMHPNSYLFELQNNSEIVTQDQFVGVGCYIPMLFKAQVWKLLYSNLKDGSSLHTLFRQCDFQSPVIIFVKDVDGYVFGAYISDAIKFSKKFYGSGECFLFTFRNTTNVQVYPWTSRNTDIILTDFDGIAVGCGDKFGLYINQDLSGGYTEYCDTFNNDQLSKKRDYQVSMLEVWSID